MKQFTLLFYLVIALSGCAGTGDISFNQDNHISPQQGAYYKAILSWQDRLNQKSFQNFDFPQLAVLKNSIAASGWTNDSVDTVIEDIRRLTCMTMETSDHWDTPKEFVDRNFQGDCEDIAIFLLAMLKKLEYPGQVRIFAVKSQFVDHAMLKVQMPDKTWKVYETVRKTEKGMQLAYSPIVEFDEREIIFSTI